MFFDQLDETNAMVQSIFAFDKIFEVSLADLGSRLSRLWLVQHLKSGFPRLNAKCDDPSMILGHLDDRNMMLMSIMLTGQFWVSTKRFVEKLLYFRLFYSSFLCFFVFLTSIYSFFLYIL